MIINLINNFIATFSLSVSEAVKSAFIDRKIYVDNFLENLRKITWTCIPISALTVGASSIVSSIHTAPAIASHGGTSYLGGLIALGLIREGVPVMATLAIVTQFCSGKTAEIGSMKITEQLDAMKLAKVSPSSYILFPMLLAGFIGFPVIISICMFFGLIVNFFISNLLIHISQTLYISSIYNSIEINDIMLGLVKASVFGIIVTAISYTCGILTKGGSKAVGSSTRLSVVINFALVVILDYIITALWI